ncbi:MAG: glycosyltransferase family 9 protein, partial [Candidatus Omnitrophica bacterium]|nr:glycosyltransferase family 9 protein [Candidatus Omnitrophota bacterium]
GIGDVLFVTPFLKAIRREPGIERIDVLLGSRTHDVLKDNPNVNKIYVMDWDRWRSQPRLTTFFEIVRLLFELRRVGYDHYFDFSATRTYVFFAKYILGIPHRAGFDYKGRGGGFNHKLAIPEGYSSKPVTEYYLDLAREAGIDAKTAAPEFFVQDEDREEADRLLGSINISRSDLIVAVSPGGGASWGKDALLKQWPPERFADLVAALGKHFGIKAVIIAGGRGDERPARSLAGRLTYPFINTAGKVSLGVTAALLERSFLLIANDGGIVHLARSVNCPVCAIFGPASEDVYGPYPAGDAFISVANEGAPCRPCYRQFRYDADCTSRECLTDLAPERVIHAMEEKGLLKYLDGRKVNRVEGRG